MMIRFISNVRSCCRQGSTATAAALFFGGLLTVACDGELDSDSDIDVDSQPVETDEPVDSRCVQPLSISAAVERVLPWGVLQVQASGGSGELRYSVVDPNDQARINVVTGLLIGGGVVGAVYEVGALDTVCGDSVSMRVTVSEGWSISPTRATVLPGTTFTFETSGGVGEPECTLVQEGSGPTLSGCTYTAGSGGIDRVEVRDKGSEATITAVIEVDIDARFDLWGERWMLPQGVRYQPTAEGGSGVLDFEIVQGRSVRVDGASLVAVRPGPSVVRVVDRFAGYEAEVAVHVGAPRVPDATLDGVLGVNGRATGGHDLNGDGYDDVVFGYPDANLGALGSGAVYVYAGSAKGLQPDPVQIFGYRVGAGDEAGRQILLEDFDKDGNVDLLWSAELGSGSLVSAGDLYIHKGVAGGFFEEEPWVHLAGLAAFDRFGSGVAACDLNGDGWLDLAVGAYQAEDRTAEVVSFNQGQITLWKGGPDGFGTEPSQVRWGMVPDREEGWAGRRNFAMARDLDVADLNGDGRCDLVAGSEFANLDGSGSDGVIAIYLGVEGDALVSRDPTRLISSGARDTSMSIGRRTAVGDFDGDGDDDLAITAWNRDFGRWINAGVVAIYRGGDLLAPGAPVLDLRDAPLTIGGNGSSDRMGSGVVFHDVDGDGKLELLIGAYGDEVPAGASAAGVVYQYDGRALSSAKRGAVWGTSDGEVLAVLPRYGYFGTDVAIAGDTDADGAVELVVWAPRDSVNGVDLGAPWEVDLDGTLSHPLDIPFFAAQQGFGQAMALADFSGDGHDDFVMGAWGVGLQGRGANAGALYSHASARGDFAPGGVRWDPSFYTLGRGERVGSAVDTRTDFDGDGVNDLAISVEFDGKPTNYSASLVSNNLACGGSRGGSGLLMVHKGSAKGFDRTPTWIAAGPWTNGRISKVRGGLDFNGDGLGDYIIAGVAWGGGARGGAGVVLGQRQMSDLSTQVCVEHAWNTQERSANMGSDITALGDLDQDGCDDVAVGARAEDAGLSNQGLVRIFWGGGVGCGKAPQVSTLVSRFAGAQAGFGLAGGGDVDGDGVPDLAVGAPYYTVGNAAVGAVWLVPGSYLLTLPRQDLLSGELPDQRDTVYSDLLVAKNGYAIKGDDPSGLFGLGVALVPDWQNPRRSLIAVGVPRGDIGAGLATGGVVLHRFDRRAEQIDPVPVGVVAGEPLANGMLGQFLSFQTGDIGPVLMVGAPSSDMGGVDVSAGYAFPVGDK